MNPKPKGAYAVQFDAYVVALDMIRCIKNILPKIRGRNPALATQAEKAASSVPLNLAEGRRRTGRDRQHHWRIAAGSADEVLACLDVAEAWGYVEANDIGGLRELLDRILAMTWRMTP